MPLGCSCKGQPNTIIVRIELWCFALLLGFSVATLCHRRLQTQYLPLAEYAPGREASRPQLSSVGPSGRAESPPSPLAASPPAARPPRSSASKLLHGFTFAGIGNLPGDEVTCVSEPRRLPGALGSMCQPGNVSVQQCAWACEQLDSCLGIVWSPRPPWSQYSECYLKGSCPLGRLRALEGSFSWQKNSPLCDTKRKPEWVDMYGAE